MRVRGREIGISTPKILAAGKKIRGLLIFSLISLAFQSFLCSTSLMPWLICFFSVFSWFQSFLSTPGRAFLAVAGTKFFFFFGSGFPADTIS